jgi:glucose 1-dehydrogenase
MDLRLDGKVALVTGGSRGIGRGIAERLAESGADLAINYHREESEANEVADYARSLGRKALPVQADVGDQGQVQAMFDQLLAEFGRIDVLVNNAGVGGGGLLYETSLAEFDRVLKTNLYGPLFCSQLAAKQMIAQGKGGRIINVTSVHEEAAYAGDGGYSTSKGGLKNMTRTLAAELGPHGITVNAIGPGMILTDMNGRALVDQEYRESAAEQIVMRRPGVPADIGNMAVFLASDDASYCTGATYFVDGGWLLTWPPV